MKFNIFGRDICISKRSNFLHGAGIGYWYRFEGDPTDKVRLLYKTDPKNSIRCNKCKKEIREGYVWDLYFVTIGLFNSKFDTIACVECFPDLADILKEYKGR